MRKVPVMNMKNIALLVLAGATWGCSFHARSPEDYQKETAKLLASKSDDLKACYDDVLSTSPKHAGIVAIDFTVEAKTGAIIDPKVNEKKTTSPSKRLANCVIASMEGLKLDPPDQRTGVATFEYEFTPNKRKQL